MLEVFAVVFFTSTPFILFYVGYLLSSKRRKKVTQEPAPEDKVILHGHDLSKWNYLGYTSCRYTDGEGNTLFSYPIFLFASKNNDRRRSFHCQAGAKDHNYVEKCIKPWAAGEKEVYAYIQGKDNSPSDYLKEYMLERFSAEWDYEANWWGTSDKSKYNSAQTKQKRQRKPKVETATENNVVTVEFGKQA